MKNKINVIASFDLAPEDLFNDCFSRTIREEFGTPNIIEKFRSSFENACRLWNDKRPDLNGIIKVYWDDANGDMWGVPVHMKYESSEIDYSKLEAKTLFIDKRWDLVEKLFQIKKQTVMRYYKLGQVKSFFSDLKRIRIQIPFIELAI